MSVEQLRASRTKAATIFIQFTRLYKKEREALFCFFEGGDAEYYGSRIRTISRPETYHYLLCSGKSGVLGIHRMLSTRKYYQNARCAYFVDRDFDPSVESNGIFGIYETPCYSIENFYTSVSCFTELLKSRFQLPETDVNFERCLLLYEKRQQEFHDIVEDLNVWIACQRAKNTIINFDKINVLKLVTVKLEQVLSKYSIDDLYRTFPNAPQLSSREFEAKRQELGEGDRQKTFQGKFEVEFFIKILNGLVEKANLGEEPYFTEKINFSLTLSRKTLIADLSQYADTPDCLHDYLEQFRDS